MTEVKVPALGESISSGILATWHVKDGDLVSAEQPLYELETDKITSEGTAEVAGKISLKVEEGTEVEIGAVVAEIDESVEVSEESNASGEDSDASSEESSDQQAKEEKKSASEEKAGNHKGSADKPSASADEQSPAVRRIAAETGMDPANVEGTGKDGRVTKGDMIAAQEGPQKQPQSAQSTAPAKPSQPSPTPQPNSQSGERTSRRKMTPLRKRIAERLVAAQQTAAMLTTFNECDMSAVMSTRKKYQESFVDKHGVKLGFMSFFVKAVVQALKDVPGLNSQIDGDFIVENHFYDIGVAVGTPKGLIVPVLRDCDQKSFAQIEKDILDYAKKARDGKIEMGDLQGGSFTISNGGIYGSMLSTPILNMPQSGILGMHNIQQRPVAVDGQVVIRPMMYLAVSYDHRIVDGKEAVTFLVRVKEAIEAPERLLFEV